jgi:N-acetylmuramoyl-L-alanine amidase
VIPPNARRSELILEPGTDKETFIPLRLGHLEPVSEISGIKNRLINLGFDCGETGDEETPNMAAALRAFQEKNGLPATGEINQATRKKLKEIHGS